MPEQQHTLCEGCGHAACHHTGVGPKGYSAPRLACTFETDRYEVCTCEAFRLTHEKAIEIIVKREARYA